MALTNAEKQRRFQERNVVVLTRFAEDIAEKLMLMADQEKLRKVVAYLKDHLENRDRDDVEKSIALGRVAVSDRKGRRLSKTAALAAYRNSKTEPPAASSWMVEAISGGGGRWRNGVRLPTEEQAKTYVEAHARHDFPLVGYITSDVLQDDSPPNCSITVRRSGRATLTFAEGECGLLKWRAVESPRIATGASGRL
jgi:hypothetical protein